MSCVSPYIQIAFVLCSLLAATCLLLRRTYSEPSFETKILSILTSNHSSNAIQQRNVTFDLSRRSLVSACAVFLMQFPLKILSITCP